MVAVPEGTQTSKYAVAVYASTRDVRGHLIADNRFLNWGGTGTHTEGATPVVLRPAYSGGAFVTFGIKESTIRGNRFEGNARANVYLLRTEDVIVEDNTILGTRCGCQSDGTVGAAGVKIGQEGLRSVIRRNEVGDFQPSTDCPLLDDPTICDPGATEPGYATFAGIYCDTGPEQGEVYQNHVHDIDEGQITISPRGASLGIFIESRCDDWKVHHNVVANVGSVALRNSSSQVGSAKRTEWIGNTVYGSDAGLVCYHGEELVIKNNIFVHHGLANLVINRYSINK
jgi:hypothetical protein